MSFSYNFRTLRIGNSYDSGTQPEMSGHEDEATGEVETGVVRVWADQVGGGGGGPSMY